MKHTVSALLSRIKTLREYLMARLQQLPWEKVAWVKRYNPFRHVKRMDWYIINKFIGTYVYSIVLIISVSIPSLFSVFETSLRAMNVLPFSLGLPLISRTFIINYH